MPAGEAFTDIQRNDIRRAIDEAERVCGWVFAVEVGTSEHEPREHAEALHAELPDPARSILVQVDPERRTLEIVTGAKTRTALDNRAAALAALTMQTAFAGGDLARGLATGILQMAQLARVPKSLHTDTP